MIELIGLSKTFEGEQEKVHALKNVSLEIQNGEVFGVIGYSGAGKSTLIRCINLLEKPTEGKVIINGEELTALSMRALRVKRKKIGMIFQHFNLMNSRTVFSNVCYPLKGSGLSKEEKKTKVRDLLRIVGIEDKEFAYPNQLSGGQKQRVAIARALANDPEVLLCDEATSALDPKTTKSILRLLKELNRNLGLTIILITHEMSVIKEICDRVSIMENGEVVETGTVGDIFSSPQKKMTVDFIETASNRDKIFDFIHDERNIYNIKEGDVLTRVTYLGHIVGDAVISEVSRKFKIDASILFGNLEILGSIPAGELIVLFRGQKYDVENGIKYFKDKGLKVEVLKYGVDSEISA